MSQLDEIYELVKENNKMLKSQQRRDFFKGIVKIIKWAVILFLFYFVWTNYIVPMVNSVNSAVGQIQSITNNPGASIEYINLQDSNLLQSMQNLINNFPGLSR